MVKKIDAVLSRITTGFGYVSYVGIVFIMVLTVIDVFTRKLFSTGVVGAYEITERALLILIFSAFAFTQTYRGHIHVTLFLGRFPKRFSMFVFGFLGLLSAGAAGFCAYAIFEQGQYSLAANTKTAVLLIPLYPFFYIASVCTLIFTVTILWDAIKSFIGIGNSEIADDLRSTWE